MLPLRYALGNLAARRTRTLLTVAVIAAAAAVLTLAAAAVPSRLATRVSPVEPLAAT